MIRQAVEEDTSLILRFICELAEYEELLDRVVATEEDLRRSLFGPRRFAEVILASVDETEVGFALFFHNYSTFLGRPGIYLEDLYVTPECRGRGVGRELLKYLARLAVERGCGRVEWAVLDWNESAIDFYKGIGAVPVDDWTIFRLTGEPLQHLARSGQI